MSPREFKTPAREPWEEIVTRIPSHRREVRSLCRQFQHARDLVETNPALALCISQAKTWDTLQKQNTEGLIEHLLRVKRRHACQLLGFPGTESVVRILSKVTPEACDIPLLMRMRRRIQDRGLVKILSHIKLIGEAEMRLIAYSEAGVHMSVPLFLELAGSATEEFPRYLLLNATERMLRRSGQILVPFRSVEEMVRCRRRLFEKRDEQDIATVVFPPPPVHGTPYIQPLVNPTELSEEGRELNHCVSTYARGVASGWLYFYRILEPERATVSIRRNEIWEIDQIAGPGNSEVTYATRSDVEMWLGNAQSLDEKKEMLCA